MTEAIQAAAVTMTGPLAGNELGTREQIRRR
jgi:hypothetical protein